MTRDLSSKKTKRSRVAEISSIERGAEEEASTLIPTPLGKVLIVANNKGITRLAFDCPTASLKRASRSPAMDHLLKAQNAVTAYFAGKPIDTAILSLKPEGTEFQRAVWRELLRIEYGNTSTYGEIAKAVGRPGAARGVGQACGANPICLLIPCHRVVGAGGMLGGYSSGIERKRKLLSLENIRLH